MHVKLVAYYTLHSVAEDFDDDEEWAEEVQENPEIEQQLSSMTLSSNTSERSHEERLEMFYNFVEVINLVEKSLALGVSFEYDRKFAAFDV